nr:7661_t:CDS:2 [Entrophospora candida]
MTQTHKFEVNPMTCNGCSNAVKGALTKKGIETSDIKIDLTSKIVEVKTDLTADEVLTAITAIGKTAVKVD